MIETEGWGLREPDGRPSRANADCSPSVLIYKFGFN